MTDLSTCPYYRGTGTCTFGCYDYPRCMDLGPPRSERLVAFLVKVHQRLNAGAHWINLPPA